MREKPQIIAGLTLSNETAVADTGHRRIKGSRPHQTKAGAAAHGSPCVHAHSIRHATQPCGGEACIAVDYTAPPANKGASPALNKSQRRDEGSTTLLPRAQHTTRHAAV